MEPNKGGRPKGSKNKPAKDINMTQQVKSLQLIADDLEQKITEYRDVKENLESQIRDAETRLEGKRAYEEGQIAVRKAEEEEELNVRQLRIWDQEKALDLREESIEKRLKDLAREESKAELIQEKIKESNERIHAAYKLEQEAQAKNEQATILMAEAQEFYHSHDGLKENMLKQQKNLQKKEKEVDVLRGELERKMKELSLREQEIKALKEELNEQVTGRSTSVEYGSERSEETDRVSDERKVEAGV